MAEHIDFRLDVHGALAAEVFEYVEHGVSGGTGRRSKHSGRGGASVKGSKPLPTAEAGLDP